MAQHFKELVLHFDSLIVGVYLNFSLLSYTSRGTNYHENPLVVFFLIFLQEVGLIDIQPLKLYSTWRNYMTKEDRIAKRLGFFLIFKSFL